MGYDVHRFEGEIDEELMCCICREVLRDPVQAADCEHAFCIECIQGWLNEHQTCPVDRTGLTQSDLKPPPRILRNIHKKLIIKCDNEEFGCTANIKLELLHTHLADCSFNPKRPVACSLGCGIEVPLDELQNHNCIANLRATLMARINTLENKLAGCEAEVERLRETCNQTPIAGDGQQPGGSGGGGMVFPAARGEGGAASNPHNLSDEEIRWCQSLDEGRVRRWGGMISTPDNVLQGHIRRSLADSGCPARLLNELMTYSHERKWPSGLNSLEMRQVNRVCYEQYVTRRVPGRQAVVVLHLENQHMDSAFIRNPGIVLIFAHGID